MGEIGASARQLIDALAGAGQRWWQVLPLGPTSYGDSPYQSLSSFAGNELLIDFDELIAEGLLDEAALGEFERVPRERVDYGWVIPLRRSVLATVAKDFASRASKGLRAQFDTFCDETAWLEDYALFIALKNEHEGRPWVEWEPALRTRDAVALAEAKVRLAVEMDAVRVGQFLFDHQWNALRVYAGERGIGIVGDIPIFVAHDSSDVWVHQELFFLEADGNPSVVAGVPPDYFSATGQRWGNRFPVR